MTREQLFFLDDLLATPIICHPHRLTKNRHALTISNTPSETHPSSMSKYPESHLPDPISNAWEIPQDCIDWWLHDTLFPIPIESHKISQNLISWYLCYLCYLCSMKSQRLMVISAQHLSSHRIRAHWCPKSPEPHCRFDLEGRFVGETVPK